MGGKWKISEKSEPTRKDRFQAGFERWIKDGAKGVFAGFGDPLPGSKGFGKGGNKPDKEDPPLPPVDDDTDVDPSMGRPKSNSWPDIVAFNFPKGAGKYYKDGGLVRGGGKAVKGRGRGKIV